MPDAPRKVAQGPMAHVELQILLALSRGPCHGYELMREIARSTAGLIAPGPGTLYVALRRLADGGAISELDRAAGQQTRRRYRITSSGRTRLAGNSAGSRGCCDRPRRQVGSADLQAAHERQRSHARSFILGRRCRQARPVLPRADARPVWGRPGRYDGRTYRRRRDAWRRAGCPAPLAAPAGRFRCGARIGIPRRLVCEPVWSRAIGISQPRDRIRSMDRHFRCLCIQFPLGRDAAR